MHPDSSSVRAVPCSFHEKKALRAVRFPWGDFRTDEYSGTESLSGLFCLELLHILCKIAIAARAEIQKNRCRLKNSRRTT
jgi:hypothetical protein